MPWTNYTPSRPRFVADEHSIDRLPGGRQIDWANITANSGVVPPLNADGKKWLKAGTAVGDLLGTGKLRPRVVTTNPAIGLLETDAVEGELSAPLSGYGVMIGGAVFENLLPDATGGPPATLPAAIKTELQTAGVGTGWAFFPYVDTR